MTLIFELPSSRVMEQVLRRRACAPGFFSFQQRLIFVAGHFHVFFGLLQIIGDRLQHIVVVLGRRKGMAQGLTEDYLEVSGDIERALPARFPAQLSLDADGQFTAIPVEDAR